MYQIQKLLLIFILFNACQTGKLSVIADLPKSLKEASAIETVVNSDLLWTIEDSGNKNNIYGLNTNGDIIKDIDIKNSSNIDWEDLTSDKEGNLYIGDFGNNSKNRDDFTIYKISDLSDDKTNAQRINFMLPKDVKPKDFEAFFIWNGFFYVFSKENKSSMLFKVPNKVGLHTAILVKEFNLDGKNHRITSADISDDGKTIVLLNHDKLWKISNFKGDNFFDGKIEELKFDHNSQKEGICFIDSKTVYITDERDKGDGGNLYEFKLN
ncbi:hypothetical protein EYD45_03740 [Hyunsoonleella flava]|uniref:T9SS C-terminal target domain-containing protein n=1 Tax=Hyunsoonleella flava TaxID=2527939 RepID=A0A4Q9FF58_9FLAO|nr:hypothetical protein [Hyunsoonleella flava]TBN05401.1 hypothetical protein EYD45_03740 [Hyunsoonleella flava]